MELRLSAFALWCAVVVAARASAYTVDCDPTITDCAALLGKLSLPADAEEASTTAQTTTTTKQHRETTTEESKPQPRLLNLSVDELQNFANALHNQTDNLSKKLSDLSDVTLDGDEDEELPKMEFKNKIANRFFSNLREPFNPLQPSLEKKSDEVDTCMEKEASYKIGDVINRGCEESCECMPGGIFDCSPRCKHPYIRIGKSLNDPLCFESPVDECCSIIACSTGNEMKGVKIEVCRHLNDTYQLGAKWHIGCEQTCTCEKNSVVTCKPRCSPLPPSDKCINVQDPKDECCEVQVCDVSQDVHEVLENSTSTTTTTQSPRLQELTTRTFTRPLVLPEPIGSIKVLQNNTVRVNLIHPNNTEDPIHLLLSNDGGKTFKGVELTYTNLILNLKGGKDYILKTKETGTKFNFTITAMDDMSGEKEIVEKIGCHQDGAFYAVGEEFHIGCTELCECTGKETRECAALVCPSHVGLELISKGCVRWAPSPPAEPPNCCPRSARCLSDGTCHYKGVPVPNWSEVPISLTGCEERCFCENGDLDCQEVCSPLSPVPPQTLRCPPMHRPTPVNISDEDCCKQWGCEPNAHHGSGSNFSTNDQNIFMVNYVTPYPKTSTTTPSFILPTPADITNVPKFYKHLHPDKPYNKPKTLPMPFNIDTENLTPNKMPDNNPIFNSQKKPLKIYLKPNENIHQIIEQSHHGNQPIQFESPTRKGPMTNKNDFNFFLPSFKPETPSYSYFQPGNYILPTKPPNSLPSSSRDYTSSGYNKVTVLHSQDWKNTNFNDDFWSDEIKSRSSKRTNPFETVLLKVPKTDNKREKPDKNPLNQNFVNHMDIESQMTKHLERSTKKNSTAIPGHAMMPPDFTPKPQTTQQQSFLPTIPPEIHFPQDDIADYDQNNIHRPVNPLVPGDIPGLPPGLHVPPNYGEDNKKLSVISLQSDSPTSVKMLFGLPPVLVGLRGSVDLRYTDKPDEDISQWYSQVFAPADEVLTTPRLEFRLTGLKPSTPYKIRGKLYLHNLPVEPESEVYAVRTQDLPTMPPVEEKKREIDSRLTVVDANDTTAHISWRHFSEDELQFIDGIQVRYRPVGTPIYSMTELLHHTKTLAELHSLRPGSRYEASLVLIPPPRATTELHDPGKVEFNTASYIDPYNWSVTVEAVSIESIAAELTWRGIPSPPERWVRVYRAASTCGERDSSAEHDAFRLAHRDITPKLTLTSLLPDTRCRVWLELFLTNGKVKTSNVLEIHTKSLDSPQPIDNEIEAASISGGRTAPRGDYYGALVVVGVVAALGAVTSLLLLLVVVRRHRPRSVPITSVPSAPRESSLPPYDNPAYKLELQQETMDL